MASISWTKIKPGPLRCLWLGEAGCDNLAIGIRTGRNISGGIAHTRVCEEHAGAGPIKEFPYMKAVRVNKAKAKKRKK